MDVRKKYISAKTAPVVRMQNNVKRQTKTVSFGSTANLQHASGSDRKSRKYPGRSSTDEQIHSGRRYLWYHEK